MWGAKRWHYCHHRPPYYWWRWANWRRLNTWIVYSYTNPYWYDYNYNVVFEDEAVYINEDPVATADDYIAMGEEIVGDPIPDEAEEIEWMPLGVFAISTSDSDSEPQMTLQLVISKDGQLSPKLASQQSM